MRNNCWSIICTSPRIILQKYIMVTLLAYHRKNKLMKDLKLKFDKLQAALAVREFAVRGFDYSRKYFVPRFAIRDVFPRLFAVFVASYISLI